MNEQKDFYECLLDVYRAKMKAEYKYINPHAMSAILTIIEDYSRKEVDDSIWEWVGDMYEA